MASLSCISILEAGSFTTDSGNVVVSSGDVQFPITAFIAGAAIGSSVAYASGSAATRRSARGAGCSWARAAFEITFSARGFSAGSSKASATASGTPITISAAGHAAGASWSEGVGDTTSSLEREAMTLGGFANIAGDRQAMMPGGVFVNEG